MKATLLFIAVTFSLQLFCQRKKELAPDILKSDFITIAANKNKAAGLKLPFSRVKVLDYRFDTSKIGFVRRQAVFIGGKYAYKKMALRNNLQKTVQDFYNGYYENCFSKDSTQLLVVVKRFWADPFPDLQVQRQLSSNHRSITFDLYLQLEFLLNRNDLYLPVKRIDTVFHLNRDVYNAELQEFKDNEYGIYEYGLAKVFESVNYQFFSDRFASSKNLKTFEQVLSFNDKRFKYPILIDTVLTEGVYLSFDEFKNNKPSITKFKVENKKVIGRVLYDMRQSDSTQIIRCWGFCDGKNIYSSSLKNPLKRIGNTFEFFYNKTETVRRYMDINLGTNGRFSSSYIDENKYLEPFQIDMETGKIY